MQKFFHGQIMEYISNNFKDFKPSDKYRLRRIVKWNNNTVTLNHTEAKTQLLIMKKSMNTIVTLERMDNDQVKITNSLGTKTKTSKALDFQMWKFKVLGDLPKNKIAVKVS